MKISNESFAMKMLQLANGTSYLPKGMEEGIYETVNYNQGYTHEGTKEEVMELFFKGMQNMTNYIYQKRIETGFMF